MKKCPQCGFRLTDVEERCLRCGAYLDTISRPDPLDLPRERFKFSGGEAPPLALETPRPDPGVFPPPGLFHPPRAGKRTPHRRSLPRSLGGRPVIDRSTAWASSTTISEKRGC